MKQYLSIITLAALSLLAASGCRKDDLQVKDDTGDLISFAVNQSNYWNNNAAGSQTKAGGDLTLFSADGDSLSLSLTVSDNITANAISSQPAETKGVMITGSILENFNIGVNAFMNGTNSIFVDDQIKHINDDHSYTPSGAEGAGHWAPIENHTYYWPKSTSLDFWAWAPATAKNTVSGFDIDNQQGKLSFAYTIPDSSAAIEMPDLMFSRVSDQSKATVSGQGKTGCVPLAFTHALAAVKFKVSTDYPATVKKISIENAVNSGSCVYSGESFSWTPGETSATFAQTFTDEQGAIDAPKTPTEPMVTQKFGDSAYNTAVFMMIPQSLSNKGQRVSITFYYSGKGEETYSGYLYTENVNKWDPGYVYEYTIRINDTITVEVTDTMTATTKSKVTTKNTGNTTAYLRAAVTAAWYSDVDGMVIKPFTVPSLTLGTNWIDGGDGYYYYKYPVQSGKATNNALFESFTAPTSPISGTHLEMQILLQGVRFDACKIKVTSAWGESIATRLETTPETPAN